MARRARTRKIFEQVSRMMSQEEIRARGFICEVRGPYMQQLRCLAV